MCLNSFLKYGMHKYVINVPDVDFGCSVCLRSEIVIQKQSMKHVHLFESHKSAEIWNLTVFACTPRPMGV